MGSASRAALAAAAAALASAKDTTSATGEQLLAAARAIDSSSQLRSVLADPAVDAAEKSALITRIFGQLDPAAARLLDGLATSRWSRPAELVDGVEELGLQAIAVASKDDIVSELFAVQSMVSSDNELELALGSKLASPDAKADLVTTLLGGKASPATVTIVRHLAQSPRGRRIGAMLATAADVVAASAQSIVATVTVAAPLSAAQQKALAARISAQFGSEPRIQYLIDPSVLGGVRVQVGDSVVDGTVASRLADLRLQLAG